MQSRHVAEAIIWGSKFHQWLYTLRIEEAKQIILRNPGVICAVLKLQKNLKTFCKIIGRCGENVGKILYKKALQVSVGPFLVPEGLSFLEPIYGRFRQDLQPEEVFSVV